MTKIDYVKFGEELEKAFYNGVKKGMLAGLIISGIMFGIYFIYITF